MSGAYDRDPSVKDAVASDNRPAYGGGTSPRRLDRNWYEMSVLMPLDEEDIDVKP